MKNRCQPETRESGVGEGGFSLVELLMAMAITMIVGLSIFQLFEQNEEVFHDQNLILDMHQNVRAVASMLADELRMAGQGVPIYASSLEGTPREATQTVLDGSNSDVIRFRSSLSNVTALVQNTLPISFVVGTSVLLQVDDASGFAAVVGADTTRFVYLWGMSGSSWTWIRGRIQAVDDTADTLLVLPTQMAGGGGWIDWDPYLILEEAVAYRLNGGNIERGTSGGFTVMTAPAMSFEVIGESFTGLTFTYYDASNNVVAPTSLANRARIRRIDFTLTAETADPLASTGIAGRYAVTMSVYPRNVALY